MRHSADDLAAAFQRQAKYCATLESLLWAEACTAVAADIRSGGAFLAILQDWTGDLDRDYLPLRLLGGLHYLALAGLAPSLARQLPSTGGHPGPGLAAALLAALAAHPDELRKSLDHPPQTNEVGRSAVFLGGFLEIAARSGLPLRLLELGASAGLNLCWDRFAYRLGGYRWGGEAAALTLRARWHGPAPLLDAPLRIASRQACDRRPVDLGDPEARLRLEGYVWPDQSDRFAALRRAVTLAMDLGIRVDRAEAVDWLESRLDARPPGAASVVYHSVVLQYFDAAARRRFDQVLDAAGRASTPDRPLAWLAFEQESPESNFELSLTYWPGGERRRLAVAQAHGRWVDWLG